MSSASAVTKIERNIKVRLNSEASSNYTLFNYNMTARPVQLKNVI